MKVSSRHESRCFQRAIVIRESISTFYAYVAALTAMRSSEADKVLVSGMIVSVQRLMLCSRFQLRDMLLASHFYMVYRRLLISLLFSSYLLLQIELSIFDTRPQEADLYCQHLMMVLSH